MRVLSSSFLVLALVLHMPLATLAQGISASKPALQGFNRHAVLNDDALFTFDDWSAERIQRFLLSKNGGLATMKLVDIDGIATRPADILWRVAGSYQISPKYLLVLLQKEQSLVEAKKPSQKQLDWAMGYGVCDNCAMNDPRIQDFKGFANQVEYAAKQHRERYMQQLLTQGQTIAGQAVGKTIVIDGAAVTPANMATAMLYSYTPHLEGNENLWRIWRRWFGRTLPNGTIVKAEDTGQHYLLRRGEKRAITPTVVASLIDDRKKIVELTPSDLDAYPSGAAMRFPNYSLVQTPDETRYLLSGEEKRRIVSNAAFRGLGFQEDEVVEASLEDLASYTDGSDLTETSKYPTGLLARDKRGGYWYIDNETRRTIPHPLFLKLSFRGRPAKLLSASELARFPISEPFRFRDGELVRNTSSPAVYVIEGGLKRPIATESLFLDLGYAWKNVLTIPDTLLATYTTGETMTPSWKEPASLIESIKTPSL